MREKNYIKINKTLKELENDFIKEFTFIRRTNNLTQQLLADYSNTSREKIARFINSPSKEQVIFTKNATESLNLIA